MAGIERFDVYVDRCLYDPESGFYAAGQGGAGRRRGDFITSPEVGPLFATVLSRAVDRYWRAAGRPDPFTVFDAGSGPGTLARALSSAPGESSDARVVTGFDRPVDGPMPPRSVLDRLDGALVIANELLDNLPVRIIERTDDGWSELYVVSRADGTRQETMRPLLALGRHAAGVGDTEEESGEEHAFAELVEELENLPVPLGVRVPVYAQARTWIRRILASGARLVVFDYGARTTAELVERGGWVRTYRQHERGHDPLLDPGQRDITFDVAFDQIPPPDRLTTQAEFLVEYGIDELVEAGREHWRRNAARPDLEAMKMRSRVVEAEALLDPAGLGGWLVAEWNQPRTTFLPESGRFLE